MNYRRSVDELRKYASMFWPEDISEQEAKLSILPLLVQTQDAFLAILNVPVSSLDKFFELVNTADMPANLFVKHLAILADVGGEMLKRISSEFSTLFPGAEIPYEWRDATTVKAGIYKFQALPNRGLSNQSLGLTGKQLVSKQSLSSIHRDAIAILLFGSALGEETDSTTLSNCQIGDYLSRKNELEGFVRQRYLFVSKITGGSKSNSLGHLAQEFVYNYLREHLGNGVEIRKDATIPGIRHTGRESRRGTTFDLVVSAGGKYVAVEVAFQVTTNSVIERKSG